VNLVKYVALLRGINVGGKNKLPMKDLTSLFGQAGYKNVRTYIQSGNVVFEAAESKTLAAKIAASIEKQFGFKVPVVLRNADEMRAVIVGNPYVQNVADHRWLHVYFLADSPDAAAVAALDPNRSTPDAFHVSGREIYLHVPNGMGKTKLPNAYFDSKLKTVSTARNWATAQKILAMLAD
jgi:uncharacterized protein (DUF1697 family)